MILQYAAIWECIGSFWFPTLTIFSPDVVHIVLRLRGHPAVYLVGRRHSLKRVLLSSLLQEDAEVSLEAWAYLKLKSGCHFSRYSRSKAGINEIHLALFSGLPTNSSIIIFRNQLSMKKFGRNATTSKYMHSIMHTWFKRSTREWDKNFCWAALGLNSSSVDL